MPRMLCSVSKPIILLTMTNWHPVCKHGHSSCEYHAMDSWASTWLYLLTPFTLLSFDYISSVRSSKVFSKLAQHRIQIRVISRHQTWLQAFISAPGWAPCTSSYCSLACFLWYKTGTMALYGSLPVKLVTVKEEILNLNLGLLITINQSNKIY